MAHTFTVTVSRGLEKPLAQELRQMGLQRVVEDRGAVRFMGRLIDGYRACLWTRIGSRVLLRLSRFTASDSDALYEGVKTIPWADHLKPNGTLWVDFVGGSKHIRHNQFGARRVKDGIVDVLRTRNGTRPSVEKEEPDLRVVAHMRSGATTISIDLCGHPLHQRTPNRQYTQAPLKESLAAALLQIANWPKESKKGKPFIDPMCGSGTLLSEAASMALDRAPNLNRRRWALQRWPGHEKNAWKQLLIEAKERAEQGRSRPISITGYDADALAVRQAQANLKAIGLPRIPIHRQALRFLRVSDHDTPGVLVTNPPYGERLEAAQDLERLYSQLGDTLRRQLLGWDSYILTTLPLSKCIGLKAKARHILHNGPIECRLLWIPISNKPPQGEKPRL